LRLRWLRRSLRDGLSLLLLLTGLWWVGCRVIWEMLVMLWNGVWLWVVILRDMLGLLIVISLLRG
jgi:hypothetical protein